MSIHTELKLLFSVTFATHIDKNISKINFPVRLYKGSNETHRFKYFFIKDLGYCLPYGLYTKLSTTEK